MRNNEYAQYFNNAGISTNYSSNNNNTYINSFNYPANNYIEEIFDLPEPEINYHNIPYESIRNGKKYSSNQNYGVPKNNLYSQNNNYDYSIPFDNYKRSTQNNNFIYQSKNNIKSYPVNTIPKNHNTFTNINPSVKYITNYNNNNAQIKFNNQNYPLNTSKYHQVQNHKEYNPIGKIYNNYELIESTPPISETKQYQTIEEVLVPKGYLINNNNNINKTGPQNSKPINSTSKNIQIPNNIKKDNIFTNPKSNLNYKIINKNENIPNDKIIKNNMPNIPNTTNVNSNTKGNNVKIVEIQKKQDNKNIINNTNNTNKQNINNNQTKYLQPNNQIKQEEKKPENNTKPRNKEVKPEKGLENIDNNFPKDVIEITEGIENIEIIPQNTFTNRPLTKNDYDNIFIRGIGIINLGNTCFINSCLQALIHCKLFMHKFFDKSKDIDEKTMPISYNFLLLCIAMIEYGKIKGKNFIDISYFKYIFGKKHAIFNGYTQNDSQEFCRIFLEDLSTELNEAKNKNIYRTLTNTEGKTKKLRDEEFDKNFKDREKSIITDLFYSQIITSFQCKCGSEIYSFQKLLDFPLLLPEKENKVSIIDLLKNYFKSEYVEFEAKCEKCKQKEKHKKEMRISRPPEILILSLQRINETTKKKNECLVTFPNDLNLYDYIDHDIGFDKESDYTLFSIINHVGDMNAGHYFTYVKPLKSEFWHIFNDSSVSKLDTKTNIFKYAYALFYIKKKYKYE